MKAADFDEFFESLHGVHPFKWQSRLALQVAEQGWPSVVKLPTGSGKTALIDIAVFTLALNPDRSPRRIYFVVDRRLVVDEAHRRAKHIQNKLEGATEGIQADVAETLSSHAGGNGAPPLSIKRLRGGIPREKSFIDNPLQPTVVMSTVDQVGSRLLFRGYGISEYMHPIHAALVAIDSLIIVDEAHLSHPFTSTLQWVQRYQKSPDWAEMAVAKGLLFVEMSATPPLAKNRFSLISADEKDPVLEKRLRAEKPADLVEVATDKIDRRQAIKILATAMAEHAQRLMDKAISVKVVNPVVGVVANRVLTARLAWENLQASGQCEAILLTGRMRPLDRATVEEAFYHRIRAGRQRTKTHLRCTLSQPRPSRSVLIWTLMHW